MKANDPLNAMATAINSALIKDLPDIEFKRRSGETAKRRPRSEEIAVYQFPQGWGSTALGFGGIGGAAITSADTTVVESLNHCAVYFAGRLAYVVEAPNQKFWEDVNSRSLAEVGKQGAYRRKRPTTT